MPADWASASGTTAPPGDCSEPYSVSYGGVHRALGVFMMGSYAVAFYLLFTWYR